MFSWASFGGKVHCGHLPCIFYPCWDTGRAADLKYCRLALNEHVPFIKNRAIHQAALSTFILLLENSSFFFFLLHVAAQPKQGLCLYPPTEICSSDDGRLGKTPEKPWSADGYLLLSNLAQISPVLNLSFKPQHSVLGFHRVQISLSG